MNTPENKPLGSRFGGLWRSKVLYWLAVPPAVLLVCILAMMWWWDKEVPMYDSVAQSQAEAAALGEQVVVGTLTTDALVQVVDHLLHKRGGYLSNDVLPPGALMDNVPNWEFGALVQSRDLARALRNGFSRSLTQSIEDEDLAEAEPLLSSPNDRWLLPSCSVGTSCGATSATSTRSSTNGLSWPGAHRTLTPTRLPPCPCPPPTPPSARCLR